MGYPNSVEEITPGMIAEGIESLEGFELEEYKYNLELAKEERKATMLARKGYGYWLDNCGDGTWYCEHCLQPECGKREAKCSLSRE